MLFKQEIHSRGFENVSMFITTGLKMCLNWILLSVQLYIARVHSILAQSHSALWWRMSYFKGEVWRLLPAIVLKCIMRLCLVTENESTPRQQLLEHFLRLLQRSDHVMHVAPSLFCLILPAVIAFLSLKSMHGHIKDTIREERKVCSLYPVFRILSEPEKCFLQYLSSAFPLVVFCVSSGKTLMGFLPSLWRTPSRQATPWSSNTPWTSAPWRTKLPWTNTKQSQSLRYLVYFSVSSQV